MLPRISINTKHLFLICFIIFPQLLWSQNFRYKAKLNPVSASGFYKIRLNSSIGAQSDLNFNDLRIFDNDGHEVPYLLEKQVQGQATTEFIAYATDLKNEPGKQTIIVENKNKKTISQLLFEMKNAEASRSVRISGSDNKKDWFVVKDSFTFTTYNDNELPSIQKQLQFPGTDYNYYKIEINTGKSESPLNIERIGNLSSSSKEALFQPVTGISYTQTDSNKSTFIHLKCSPANKIDRLGFVISSPEMFRRNIIISYTTNPPQSSEYSSKREYKTEYAQSMNYELSSDRPTTINCSDLLGTIKNGSLLIEIKNLDDAPLHIKSIEAFQLINSITAKLDRDKNYFLYFGDSTLQPPAYDIVYFTKNIPATIPTIDALQVQAKEIKDKDEYDGSKDKYIVWIGLAVVGGIILLLTISMMRKMKSPNP